MSYYIYGMRLRPMGLGCQPKDFILGLETTLEKWLKKKDIDRENYHDVIIYQRELSDQDLSKYELDYLGEIIR